MLDGKAHDRPIIGRSEAQATDSLAELELQLTTFFAAHVEPSAQVDSDGMLERIVSFASW
ncbi:MAG: hypothetical protein ABI797_05960 [Chloroflexota bacterium]